MIRYLFDANSGEYSGEVSCQAHPLHEGEWLVPDNSTELAPPHTTANQVALFKERQWCIESDYREQTVYAKADQTELKIDTIGSLPQGYTQKKPPTEHYRFDEHSQTWQHDAEAEQQAQRAMERSWAQQQLNLTDKYMVPDYPISAEQRQLVLEYRKQLRNPLREANKDYPKQAWRPLWPSQLKAPES